MPINSNINDFAIIVLLYLVFVSYNSITYEY